MSYANRWDQTKASERHGTNGIGQGSDGTGTVNHFAKYDATGLVTDSAITESDVLTVSGAGGGSAATLTGQNSWYGQVPRGAVNGSNTIFRLDYKLANPFAILHLNGIGQLPAVQGDPANPLTTMAVPGSEFSITDTTLTVANPPRAGEKFYIYYFRKDAVPAVSSATVTVWTSYTAGSGTPHAFASANYIPSGGSPASILSNNALYSRHQDNFALTSVPATVAGFSGAAVEFYLAGTLPASDPNDLNIYDCYITLILVDASVYVLRPIGWGFYAGTGSGGANSWQPATGYASADKIIDSNGNIQMCTVAGTSGSSAPIWATSGNTTDNGVTWTYQGNGTTQTSITGQIQNPTLAYDADSVPPATFATFSRSFYNGFAVGGKFTLYF